MISTRYVDQSLSQYEYVIHSPIDDQSFRLIKIDCNNGKNILDIIGNILNKF